MDFSHCAVVNATPVAPFYRRGAATAAAELRMLRHRALCTESPVRASRQCHTARRNVRSEASTSTTQAASPAATTKWHDNRMGSNGMGEQGNTMEETLIWRFWREWGGNKHCRAMINGAPTRPSGGRNFIYRNPDMMEERLLALRRLICPSEADMTVEMMEHVMRVPIKEPRVLSLSPAEMARRIVELRFKAVRQNVAQMVIFEPAVLVVEDEELDSYLKEKNFL